MILISSEEEVSGDNGISSVMSAIGHIDAAIVGEPTGMHPAVAERGLMVVDGQVKGKAGHAARKEGENAIYKALKDIETIAGLKFQNGSEWLPEPGAQVTMIEAGTGHNVVPDICRFVVDVRSNDIYSNETMLDIKTFTNLGFSYHGLFLIYTEGRVVPPPLLRIATTCGYKFRPGQTLDPRSRCP